jgi:hypothetical protein
MRNRKMLRTTMLLGLAVLGGAACENDAIGPDTDEPAMSIIRNQTLVQVDRMGLPAVNTAFVSASADKDAFNRGTPATDEDRFLGTLTQTITARFGLNSAQAGALADFVLPDVLPLGDLSGFPNGRRLADDVIDIELGLIFGVFGPAVPALQSDGVDANDRAFGGFPHLAPPQTN